MTGSYSARVPRQVLSNVHALFLWHNWPPDGLLEEQHFHGRLLVGQRCAAACRLGCGGGRQRGGNLQGGGVWSSTERRLARAHFSRWRGLRSSHGRAHHVGSAHAAHRLRRCHRYHRWAKVQSLGLWRSQSTRLGQASGFPRRGSGQSRSRSWAHFPLVQKEKRLCRYLCEERGRQDIHKAAFRVAQTVVACASLAKQAARWASEAHVLLRFRSWNDTRAVAPRARDTALRGRGSSASARESAAGFRSGERLAFSHRSHTLLVRQSSRPKHAQRAQLAGLVEHSQLRKLRSWLFPNRRYPGWMVEHERCPTLDEATTLVAQLESLRGGSGPNRYGAHHTREATCCPTGSGAGTLGTHCRGGHNRGLGAAALGPWTAWSLGRRMGSTISWCWFSHFAR